MAVIHYDPFADDETEITMCGTHVWENYDWSSNWYYVTCKKCLKKKYKIEYELKEINNNRSEQEGAFVDFMISEDIHYK